MPKQSAKKKVNFKLEVGFFLSCLGTISILFLAGFNINTYLARQRVLGAKKESGELLEERLFWENMVSRSPDYIDGWLELAKVSYELGDKDYAIGALNSAKSIDPNFDKTKRLERELGLLGL